MTTTFKQRCVRSRNIVRFMTVTFQVKVAAKQRHYGFSMCGTDGNLFVLSRMNNESNWIGDWKP